MKKLYVTLCAITLFSFGVKAQETIQYYRPNDQRGINQFETSKQDTVKFTGLKVK